MNIHGSVKFASDHVAEVARINVGLGERNSQVSYGLFLPCVPGERAKPARVAFTISATRPGRFVTRFGIAVPYGGLSIFGALIIALAKRHAREQQQRAAQ